MINKDLIIIGAGPAGMSAALNAENDGLNFEVFESERAGWFPRVSVDSHYVVDNYLGFSKVTGTELISKFLEHLSLRGIKIGKGGISDIFPENGGFRVLTNKEDYQANSVILATGTIQKQLEIPGIEKFIGRSVFYYCVPDGDQFKNKKVVVLGGRNTGAVTAVYLKNLGCDVEIIERDSRLNCKQKYAQRVSELAIPLRLNSQIISIEEEHGANRLKIRNPGGIEDIVVGGLFVCIGLLPNNSLAKRLNVGLNGDGYVNVNSEMATNIPGIYAAGDITGNLKQIVVAAAQGSIAAYNANKYLRALPK